MTEDEWLACTDPTPMMDFLRGKASKRKLRLFACACWRRQWRFLTREEDRSAVAVAERFADGLASTEDLPEPFDENGRSAWPYVCYPATEDAPYHADVAAYMIAGESANAAGDSETIFDAERGRQTDLVRDIFGNPFRPVAIKPSWLSWNSATITKMAKVIYEELRFADLLILADALEDAGCENPDILNHCREPSEHVRGCWVVDLLLSKN
jgi:hypothetical protein